MAGTSTQANDSESERHDAQENREPFMTERLFRATLDRQGRGSLTKAPAMVQQLKPD